MSARLERGGGAGRRSRLARLAAAMLALLLADAAVGTWLLDRLFWRALPPFGAVTHENQLAWLERQRAELAGELPPSGLGEFDPLLGWAYRPRSSAPELGLAFNSRGWRGTREYAERPPPGVLRAAAFGDSFTYCEDVPDEESWEHLLEAADPGIEMLNLGVGAYGTDQALLRFRREAPELGAEVFVLGLLLENIGRNVNRYRPLWNLNDPRAVAKPRFLLVDGRLELLPLPFATRGELIESVLDGSVLERLGPHERWSGRGVPRWLEHSAAARLVGDRLARRERAVRGLWEDAAGEPFQVTAAILAAFHEEARALGAKAAFVLVYPGLEDLDGFLDEGRRYWGLLLEELDRRAVPYLDLAEVLAPERRAEREGAREPALYTSGRHLARRGNALVAEAVRVRLRSDP